MQRQYPDTCDDVIQVIFILLVKKFRIHVNNFGIDITPPPSDLGFLCESTYWRVHGANRVKNNFSTYPEVCTCICQVKDFISTTT